MNAEVPKADPIVEAQDRLDEVSISLCAGYRDLGVPAFVLRAGATGDVRVIGPALKRDAVVRLLRQAADQIESSNYEPVPIH